MIKQTARDSWSYLVRALKNSRRIMELSWAAFWSFLIFLFSYLTQLNLIIPMFLICVFAYVRIRKLNFSGRGILKPLLLILIIFAGSYFMLHSGASFLYLPFCAIPMLVTLLFGNLEISLLIILVSAVSVGAISPNPFVVCVMFLTGGIVGSLFVLGARKRTTVIQAGIIAGITQTAVLIFLDRLWIGAPVRYAILILNGTLSSIIILGVLPLFEYLFNTVTNISLLELADFNHPLLQRMTLEAPGTYHHSLIVGNLSESACRSVGANALLARIGAYYHDVGKLNKPEYFSENQAVAASKHDNLSPTISKMVIMNHVKEGEELAKKYKINPPLIDFITQHHGNSLVYYFYRRALESLEEDQDVQEEGFRYPGPKPNTKETAIVLLADSVEAATRALKEPAPSKIEEVVHKVINNKFIDGQLDECNLTLKDLEKISAVFIRILSGIYHSRVSYPDEQRNENNHKKSAKEDSRLSDKDKKNNP